jgi:DNA-binding PadR family transcriptional regulator
LICDIVQSDNLDLTYLILHCVISVTDISTTDAHLHQGETRNTMTDTLQNPEEFLPLTPAVFNILLALADSEKHGYGIMLEVEANTKGQVIMGPGTLYGSIKRMLKAGLIEESDERADLEMDDQRRRYYRLTNLGRRTLHMEAERLVSQVMVAKTKNVLTMDLSGGAS